MLYCNEIALFLVFGARANQFGASRPFTTNWLFASSSGTSFLNFQADNLPSIAIINVLKITREGV
jgi:hypothetical protein